MNNDSRLWAFFAYLLSIVGFILVYALRKHDRFAMFHAKQSLVLFIAYLAVWGVTAILGKIIFLGVLISAVLWLTLLVLWILGLIFALSGKEKALPLIGEFAHKINF